MSLNNYYTVHELTRQRHQELLAAAAGARLARAAVRGHQPWWRRASRATPARKRVAAVQPDACLPS